MDNINHECMACVLKHGCLMICAANPEDVMKPPCEKYAIGLTKKDVFWTRPIKAWLSDPANRAPDDVRFVIFDEEVE